MAEDNPFPSVRLGAYKDELAAIDSAAEIAALLHPAFTAYTPTLTASSADPTLGSGSSATGYYIQSGKRVFGYASFIFGSSGVAAGTGSYGLLLPVEPINRVQPIGTGYMVDFSDNIRIVVAAVGTEPNTFATSTRKVVLWQSNVATDGIGSGDNPCGAAVPWTWAANDQIHFSFDYEAA